MVARRVLEDTVTYRKSLGIPIAHPRDESTFAFHHSIIVEFGKLDHILDWCRNELQNEWRYSLGEEAWSYQFYFDSDKDAMIFILKWNT